MVSRVPTYIRWGKGKSKPSIVRLLVSWMHRPTDIYEVTGSTLGPATYLSLRFCHELISTVILSPPLIQVGQLSVADESMDMALGNGSLHRKRVDILTDGSPWVSGARLP